MIKIFLSLFVLIFFSFSSVSARGAVDCKCSYADLVSPLIPAVVNISTSKKQSNNPRMPGFPPGLPEEFNQFFERFGMAPPDLEGEEGDESQEDGQDQDLKPYSAGSGFIIDKSGYIVTNHHVISDAEKITVKLHNDKKYDAKLIGSDSRTDLALLKVDIKEDLPFVPFGNSDEVRVGDPIIAIGNPFGLGGTVTTGIISARARDINAGAGSIVDNFLQTDAAINKGNSGGPMFNMKGEVIGINAAIYSPSGGNVGIGFAVPSSLAEPVIKQMQKSGKVSRAWLGVTIQSTEDLAEGLGISDGKGALVVSVAEGSAAEKVGINVGDIILSFDGKEITSSKKLPRIVAETPVGKNVKIELLSKGKPKTVALKLEELDSKTEKKVFEQGGKLGKEEKFEIQGISLADITDKLRQKYSLKETTKGILIVGLKKNSFASRSGLKVGDVVVAVNQEYSYLLDDFKKLIEEAKKAKKTSVMLWISRGGTNLFLQLPVK